MLVKVFAARDSVRSISTTPKSIALPPLPLKFFPLWGKTMPVGSF
jgi:hypothetical protein